MSRAGELPGRPVPSATPVAGDVVARPRLHALLDEGLQRPVTVVAATAGWGKTLLVATWVAARAAVRPSAWVRFDSDDGPSRFWSAVASALAPVAGPEAGAALRRLTAGSDEPADLPAADLPAADLPAADLPAADLPSAIAAALDLAERPVVLVLDDLHEVTSPEVHAGLVRLVEQAPAMLSVVVLTRRDPPWPLSRLRLAGLLSEVREPDLAFRHDEAVELFALMRVEVDPAQVRTLVARTEGWPAALRLVALHLTALPDVETAVAQFSGDDHSVAGYLVTEVLEGHSPDLLTFLQEISSVELVSADLAEALTGRRDSEVLLTELAASHLLTQALDRSGRWYRVHRLIRDVLRARPVPRRERRDLGRRAAEWYRRNGMPLEAIRSAVDGGLWPLAADLVARHLTELVLGGRPRDLERVLVRAPRTATAAHPELACGLAAARVVRGVVDEVDELVAAGRARLAALPERRVARARVLLDLTAGAVARVRGDWDTAVALHRSVPTDTVALAGLGLSRPETVRVLVNNVLGTAALLAADLPTAERELRSAVSVALTPRPLPQLDAAGYLSLVQCARGELGPAEHAALDVVRAAAEAGLERTPQVVGAYLTMAQVALDRADPDEADDWLGRTAEVEAVAGEPHVRAEAALLRAARRESVGHREWALSGLRAAAWEIDLALLPRALQERWALAEAGLLAGLGDRLQARATLRRTVPASATASVLAAARLQARLDDLPAAVAARKGLEPEPHPRGQVDVSLFDTALAATADDEPAALDRLEDALTAAAPWSLRRPFLTEAIDLRPLLERRLEQGTVVPTFAVDVLGLLTAGPPAASEVGALLDPLTERERTVLRYLASTLSNVEIAAELYVSVNTVKTHERALYRKLGVTNRREAVSQARALDLI